MKGERRGEVAFAPGTLLIGDLHLDLDQVVQARAFVEWLEALPDVPRLVILGDFFEYWFGKAQARSAGGELVCRALSERAERGAELDLVPGNRDFLLDGDFEARSGVRLHPNGFRAFLPGGTTALVIHGDELCTLDRDYLALRRVLRSGAVRTSSRWLPAWAGRAVARRLRRASRAALEVKLEAEAEQQPDAVRSLAAAEGAEVLICGHAHRFRDSRLEAGPRWLVLDAWGGERDVLCVTADGDFQARSSRDVEVRLAPGSGADDPADDR